MTWQQLFKKWRESSGVKNLTTYGCSINQVKPGKIYKKYKLNEKFVNMVNQFGVSKSAMAFKIGVVKFIKNYPKILGFSSLFEE